MLANLPVEIILLICKYPESKDLGQLAWTNKRMMQIIKRHLPTVLERKALFYCPDPPEWRKYASFAYFKDKLYHLGGEIPDGVDALKSCLCFDPSAPVGSRISRIADMDYERQEHSLIVANGKLYAIGG
ncbi:hypothetical protein WR25_06046 [Diploscapter pachys]|uniref:F-box domain-containing protein n=1 Tax=Diploscapter pachys TaxID=2018661 RepID=A0A2A2J2W9_9BILA|nr:hypothetical protein WR25_06046 [Diploscapter pachys]